MKHSTKFIAKRLVGMILFFPMLLLAMHAGLKFETSLVATLLVIVLVSRYLLWPNVLTLKPRKPEELKGLIYGYYVVFAVLAGGLVIPLLIDQ